MTSNLTLFVLFVLNRSLDLDLDGKMPEFPNGFFSLTG